MQVKRIYYSGGLILTEYNMINVHKFVCLKKFRNQNRMMTKQRIFARCF